MESQSGPKPQHRTSMVRESATTEEERVRQADEHRQTLQQRARELEAHTFRNQIKREEDNETASSNS